MMNKITGVIEATISRLLSTVLEKTKNVKKAAPMTRSILLILPTPMIVKMTILTQTRPTMTSC